MSIELKLAITGLINPKYGIFLDNLQISVHFHQNSPVTEDQDIYYQTTFAAPNYIYCQELVRKVGHLGIAHACNAKYS